MFFSVYLFSVRLNGVSSVVQDLKKYTVYRV